MPIIGRFKPFDEKVYTFRAKGLNLRKTGVPIVLRKSTDTFAQKYRYFRFCPSLAEGLGGNKNGRKAIFVFLPLCRVFPDSPEVVDMLLMRKHIGGDGGEFLGIRLTQFHAAVVPVGYPSANDMTQEHYLKLVQPLSQSH